MKPLCLLLALLPLAANAQTMDLPTLTRCMELHRDSTELISFLKTKNFTLRGRQNDSTIPFF